MDAFISSIILFAGNFNPRNWAFCSGQVLAIAQNTALFSLLGTNYGGNGSTTYALPDLRGRTPIAPGQGPGLPAYNLGEMAGTPTVTLLSNNMPFHTHTASLSNLSSIPQAATVAGDAITPENNYLALSPKIGSGPNATQLKTYATPTTATGNVKPMVGNTVSGSATNSAVGGNAPFSIMQPYLAINYIICQFGIFPSRN
ncbi:phage tail protein [Pedobacter helvus]|uniref:Phage tail protein n=1 Tax=Pedobacter helvus TaxID=2563444 RepID=A0ABW9JKN0_9SPHI|nr:tail fiber protein [Pedobacter ureilyticus]